MEELGSAQPGPADGRRGQPVGGRPIRHERALPIGRHEGHQAGRRAGDPRHADADPVPAQGLDQQSSPAIPADRADEGRAHPQAGQPARRAGGRAALPEADHARRVGATHDRSHELRGDVDDEVAEHDDVRSPAAASGGPGRGGRGAVGHGCPSIMAGVSTTTQSLDQLAIDTIRTLAMDAVQQANSGHPGAPMGMAPMAYVLWTRYLRHAPTHPTWPDRDRFVLSAGHASMLLYALLHLTGYDLTLDELTRFRQWGSRTPGHPEYRLTPG